MPHKGSRRKKRTEIEMLQFDSGEREEGDSESEDEVDAEAVEEDPAEENNEDDAQHESDGEEKEEEKQRAIWDSIREDHFELFDQLPQTLQRHYMLLRELDQQNTDFSEDLLSTIHKYINLRRNIDIHMKAQPVTMPEADVDRMDVDSTPAGPSEQEPDNGTPPPTTTSITEASCATPPPTTATSTSIITHTPFPKTPLRAIPPHLNLKSLETRSPMRTPTPSSIPQDRIQPPETSREMLSHIAWLAEEVGRTANEKVHLVQTAHDTIERQIRLLAQAIKEQEMALSLGIRPGTQLAPIILPDVVVPTGRWLKPVAAEDVDSDDEIEFANEEPHIEVDPTTSAEQEIPALGIVNDDPNQPSTSTAQPIRKKPGRKPKGKKKTPAATPVAEPAVEPVKLTITLPPPPNVDLEKRYCYCNEVSYGDMIACDNESCKYEWFHFGCAGLSELPPEDEDWYCGDCQPKAKRKRRRH